MLGCQSAHFLAMVFASLTVTFEEIVDSFFIVTHNYSPHRATRRRKWPAYKVSAPSSLLANPAIAVRETSRYGHQ